jgi:hypothetical protein
MQLLLPLTNLQSLGLLVRRDLAGPGLGLLCLPRLTQLSFNGGVRLPAGAGLPGAASIQQLLPSGPAWKSTPWAALLPLLPGLAVLADGVAGDCSSCPHHGSERKGGERRCFDWRRHAPRTYGGAARDRAPAGAGGSGWSFQDAAGWELGGCSGRASDGGGGGGALDVAAHLARLQLPQGQGQQERDPTHSSLASLAATPYYSYRTSGLPGSEGGGGSGPAPQGGQQQRGHRGTLASSRCAAAQPVATGPPRRHPAIATA